VSGFLSKNINPWLEAITHIFYPRCCELCTQPLSPNENILCWVCDKNLPRYKNLDATASPSAQRLAGLFPYKHAQAYGAFVHDGDFQTLLHLFKYKNRKDIGEYLSKDFAKMLTKTSWIKEIDLIIPVPLHLKKERKRGFNQSHIIVDALSQALQIPCEESILKRIRHTESQTLKNRMERVENVKGAFALSPDARLETQHILLVDDVLTSGSTIVACYEAFAQFPQLSFSVATIAVAEV